MKKLIFTKNLIQNESCVKIHSMQQEDMQQLKKACEAYNVDFQKAFDLLVSYLESNYTVSEAIDAVMHTIYKIDKI